MIIGIEWCPWCTYIKSPEWHAVFRYPCLYDSVGVSVSASEYEADRWFSRPGAAPPDPTLASSSPYPARCARAPPAAHTHTRTYLHKHAHTYRMHWGGDLPTYPTNLPYLGSQACDGSAVGRDRWMHSKWPLPLPYRSDLSFLPHYWCHVLRLPMQL